MLQYNITYYNVLTTRQLEQRQRGERHECCSGCGHLGLRAAIRSQGFWVCVIALCKLTSSQSLPLNTIGVDVPAICATDASN